MGSYNPSQPAILGEEWVPIRNENLELSPATNYVEAGHGFSLTTSRALQDGRYYVNTIPPTADSGQHMGLAIYPAGREDLSGPVQSVVIPVSSAICTGGNPSGDVTSLLLTPTNFQGGVTFSPASAATMGIRMQFATNLYPQLNGKRILGINLLQFVTGSDSVVGENLGQSGPTLLTMTTEFGAVPSTNYIAYEKLHEDPNDNVVRIPLGEINPFWTANSPVSTVDRMHWTYNQLLRLSPVGSLPKLFITIATGNTLGNIEVGAAMFYFYAALEVFYCEENRVAFGAVQLGTSLVALGKKSLYGANTITMRDMAYNSPPVLAAGDYTAVLTSPFIGSTSLGTIAASNYPLLNAARELYGIPPHPGIQVNLPFPLDDTAVGKVLTKETIQVLPQLSLHASGGTLTEPHVYGRQAVAQVYGSITATQEILDSVVGSNRTYPWVRFYARRFGDTTVPLRLSSTSPTVSGSGVFVQITPDEWDALTEVIDGWKEVTLRFPAATPPSMGTGMTPTWRWSATGELAGNRWEVLGAVAPALSGIPGNTYNLVTPSTQRLDTATYGAPTAGSTVNLGWITGYSPPVTATTDDPSSDGVLIFSQDPGPVSGFAISTLSQALSGIGQNCGLNPVGIPTSLGYNRLTWTAQTALYVEQEFLDTFSRTATSTWGTADSGQVYQIFGGTAADYNVAGGVGTVALPTTSSRNAYTGPAVGATFTDVEYYAELTVPALATGDVYDAVLMGREDFNIDNYYGLTAEFDTAGTIDVFILKDLGGVVTTIATSLNAVPYAAGNSIGFRFRIVGTAILGRIWNRSTQVEPTAWTVTAVDSSIVSGGVGLRQVRGGANTNVGLVMSWDIVTANDLATATFGSYELQRMDTVDTAWQTIMMASSASVSGFNDYEARVGLLSSYRIRSVNTYGFYGPWSATLTATITAPGVAIGMTGGHVLIFTTNEVQNGSSNLAYSSIWENQVEEGFSFAEAGFTTLQAMYDRDFFVAFRPLERGGEQFTREILVQAAAISPPTLGDFRSLRDMAWDDVSYICVRDEDGNRWLANVTVPSGRVQHYRKLYRAQIQVIEVTDTPSQVVL